jgi:hypothetical protein
MARSDASASPRGTVPCEDAPPIAVRLGVAFGQEPARVGTHEMRPVAPLADEVSVVPAALDHHVGETERQRTVAAWTDPEPLIGLAGEADMARVDDDQTHAALECRDDGSRVGEAREAGVVAHRISTPLCAMSGMAPPPPTPTLPTP